MSESNKIVLEDFQTVLKEFNDKATYLIPIIKSEMNMFIEKQHGYKTSCVKARHFLNDLIIISKKLKKESLKASKNEPKKQNKKILNNISETSNNKIIIQDPITSEKSVSSESSLINLLNNVNTKIEHNTDTLNFFTESDIEIKKENIDNKAIEDNNMIIMEKNVYHDTMKVYKDLNKGIYNEILYNDIISRSKLIINYHTLYKKERSKDIIDMVTYNIDKLTNKKNRLKQRLNYII